MCQTGKAKEDYGMMAGWEANMETGESRSYSPNSCHFRKFYGIVQAGVENITPSFSLPMLGLQMCITRRPVSL